MRDMDFEEFYQQYVKENEAELQTQRQKTVQPYDYNNPYGTTRQNADFTEISTEDFDFYTGGGKHVAPPKNGASSSNGASTQKTSGSAKTYTQTRTPVQSKPTVLQEDQGSKSKEKYEPNNSEKSKKTETESKKKGASVGNIKVPKTQGTTGFSIATLLVIALIFVLLFVCYKLFATIGGFDTKKVKATATPQVVATAEPTEVAEETPEPTPEVEVTPEPSPTPAGPKAEVNDEGLVIPAAWGVTIPERENQVYDSFFDNSCIIGNSLVEGFFMWSGMTTPRYIYSTGATIGRVLGVMDLSPITLNAGMYDNVYLMFGLNEVGSGVESFISNYKTVIEYIREYQPQANIITISITPVTSEVDADPDEVQSMELINQFNEALKEMDQELGCWYLDVYSLVVDEDGYLSSDYAYAGDGKHFEKSGYVAWADYMRSHYVDADLPNE